MNNNPNSPLGVENQTPEEFCRRYEAYRTDFDLMKQQSETLSMDWWNRSRRTVWDDIVHLGDTFSDWKAGLIGSWDEVRDEVATRLERLDREYPSAIRIIR